MRPAYVMAFDAGTTSARCLIFDHDGNVCSVAQKEIGQHFPHPGWVEQNAEEIWSAQISVAVEAMTKINLSAKDIAGIGITNQRETTVLWEKSTGKPVGPAIVWQCRRTADFCDALKQDGKERVIREKTGLVVDPYFSASKIAWMLDNVDNAREKAENGELLFGTVDTWLIWKLTKGQLHITDMSNASRTMLFNIHTRQWDEELLELFRIPRSILPEVRDSSEVYGNSDASFLGGSIPIAGIAGDQQAALFGQRCFRSGEAKNTYGTGCFLLMNTGEKPINSDHGLLTTVAWTINDVTTYALEGSVFVAGAAIQWLRDELSLIKTAPESEKIARSVQDTAGCYVVPAFTGLGAPHWNPHARGMIVGLTRGVNRSHIVRATLESLAYQTNDILRAMEQDSAMSLKHLKVDGGAANNNFLMQFQADILNVPVIRPNSVESTALGAAYLAGLAVKFWESTDDIHPGEFDRFEPIMERAPAQNILKQWKAAVDAAKFWGEHQVN